MLRSTSAYAVTLTPNASTPIRRLAARLGCLTLLGISIAAPLAGQSSYPTSSQSTTTTGCTDPSSPACATNSYQFNPNPSQLPDIGQPADYGSANSSRQDSNAPVYVDRAGVNNNSQTSPNARSTYFPPDPLTDLQKLARSSTGESLPIFGRDLFQRAPSTFAPADQIPAIGDYVVGPGDVILLRLWGQTSFNGELTVDTSGSIYVPQVGAIHVAGLTVDQLQSHVNTEIRHTYKNFSLSVNLGHLRSIQVYVIGEARRPGAYTVSSLSTILNVLFQSGGPSVQGSLRHIQVRRAGSVVGELDLYDLILKGDKSHDIRLQADDTIFIPAVGPQVALAGSVHHPAIYELRDGTTVGGLLDLAGGFTSVGLATQISLERIDQNAARVAMTVGLNTAGRATILQDGDVLFANHITPAYQKSVTIRGNLANPGRFPWHPGMRLADIIPDRMSLLTNDYWQQRNRLGVPVPLFEPARPRPLQYSQQQQQLNRSSGNLQNSNNPQSPATYQNNGTTLQNPPYLTPDETPLYSEGADPTDPTYDASGAVQRDLPSNNNPYGPPDGNNDNFLNPSDTSLTRGSLAEEQQSAVNRNLATAGHRTDIKIPAPEINWSYAVIERLNPETLKSSLVPFNLEKLVQQHDPGQNLELQPGDIVTILSQSDVHVPQDDRTKYVRLEGEFNSAGIYSVGPNETLDQLVQRAGGLTLKAYLYGASFTRESARIFQQQRLDEYINSVAISMQRAAAVRAASSSTNAIDPNAIVEQREAINQLRKLRATGRVVLEFRPDSAGVTSIPHIPMEDGDVFRVSSRPLTVNVIGAVYGQNVYLYDPSRRVEDYLLLAGKPNPIADRRHAFIIRADGSVFSREHAKGIWKNSFDATSINPGDSIVIPEQPVRPSTIRQIVDYSQVFSQLALGAAAISVIKQ